MRVKNYIRNTGFGAIVLLILWVFPQVAVSGDEALVRKPGIDKGKESSLILRDVHVEEIPVMVASSDHYVLEWIERELTGESNEGESETVLAVQPELPKSYSLSQNFPNPFNPSTTIKFDIPDIEEGAQYVDLTVYDIRGRRVRTLIDAEYEPGRYTVAWNGKNDRGSSVSSGIYLYTLRVGKQHFTRKMTVLK
jgi:hypothetical protein